jgi:hypothetical protein
MKTTTILSKLLFVIVIFIAVSCSSTQVISSWSISNPPSNAMKKVLVVGVMANRETKDQIEQAMTAALNKDGVAANTAMSVFGPKSFKDMQESEITSTLKGSDYTSIMLVSLVNKEKQVQYVPGTYYAYPYASYPLYYRRYWYMHDQMYTPGYYETTTNWVLEADIYTINGDELIYSTQTKSYDPENARDLSESFTQSIINELREKKMIP